MSLISLAPLSRWGSFGTSRPRRASSQPRRRSSMRAPDLNFSRVSPLLQLIEAQEQRLRQAAAAQTHRLQEGLVEAGHPRLGKRSPVLRASSFSQSITPAMSMSLGQRVVQVSQEEHTQMVRQPSTCALPAPTAPAG